ncbi:Putative ribonuclease H protein At1g65750, partial [Linum perenne]
RIWNWGGPSRIQFFLWLVSHEKLLTNLERKRRHMSQDSSCPRCGHSEESILHILRDCPFAVQVWDSLGFHHREAIRHSTCMDEWMRRLLGHDRSLDLGVMCWYLWKSRNDRVFNNNSQTSPRELSNQILSWADTIRRTITVDWMVLNTDGSVLKESGSAAAGGLIRDALGRCLAAFSVNLGRCSITRAKLRGLIAGLDLSWDRGWRKVAVQCDSRVAIALLSNEADPYHHHSGEVRAFRNLMLRDWEVTLNHIFHEGNQAADFLAGVGHNFPPGFHLFPISDCNLGYFVRRDSMGISEPRDIPS